MASHNKTYQALLGLCLYVEGMKCLVDLNVQLFQRVSTWRSLYLPLHEISNTTGINKRQCGIQCQQAGGVSFLFHQQSRECHIYSVFMSSDGGQVDGWQYYSAVGVSETSVSPTNIAVSKQAWQSTDYQHLAGVVADPASLAVDENTNGNYRGYSCTHTNTETNPWWMVDIGYDAVINRVVIYNRQDCCSDRLANLQFLVSKSKSDADADVGTVCATYTGPPAINPVEIPCTGLVHGQFLKITRQAYGILTLCEVEIYS